MAIISKGIRLYLDTQELNDLQEIPDLGGEAEAIEVTTLTDPAHMYIDGILNYGDSLAFKFLYEKTQFMMLSELNVSGIWKVELPDKTTCSFTGPCSVKLDGVGVNAALTYTLYIKPDSEMIWGSVA